MNSNTTLSKALYNREPKKATSSWKNKHHTLQHNKVVSRIWHPKKNRSNVPFVMKTGIIFLWIYKWVKSVSSWSQKNKNKKRSLRVTVPQLKLNGIKFNLQAWTQVF
jgi:hypothetical protein